MSFTPLRILTLTLCLTTLGPLAAQPIPAGVTALEKAEEIDIGSFCLSNIPKGTVKVGSSRIQPDAIWWKVTIIVKAQAASKPTAYFFSKLRAVPSDGRITSCSNSASASFLHGRLNTATIEAYFLPPTDLHSSRWEVEPGKLNVEFGNAEARISPVYGGTVIATNSKPSTQDLTGRKLWVSNSSSQLFFDQTGGVQSGILDLITTDVVLSKVSVITGTSQFDTSLTCPSGPGPNQGKVTFSMNVANSSAAFTSGECSEPNVTLPPATWDAAGAQAAITQAHANKLALDGSPTTPSFAMTGLTLTVENISYGSGSVTIKPTQPVTVGGLAGPVESRSDAIQIKTPTWTNVTSNAANIQISSTLPLVGVGDMHISSLSQATLDASFSLSAAKLPTLESVAPLSVTAMSFKVVGSPSAPFTSGSLSASSIRLAALGLETGLGPVQFQSDPSKSPSAAFAFDLDLAAPAGSFVLSDPNGQNTRVTGKLAKLHAKGDVIAKAGAAYPELTIGPGNLVLDASAQASVTPLVLGSVVQFVGSSISINTPTGLTLTQAGSTGKLDLTANAFVFPSPTLTFADSKQNFLIQAPLKTEGAADIQFDFSTGRAALNAAQITADHLVAKSSDATKAVSIAGIDFLSPDLTLGQLSVSVSQGSGLIKGEDLHFTTDSATHRAMPFWSANFAPNTGLSVPGFDASLGDTEGSLDLTKFSIEGLNLGAASGEFKSADGFDVSGSSFTLSADTVTSEAIKNGKVGVSSGSIGVVTAPGPNAINAQASFDNFSLSLDGTQAAFSGNGSIHLHNISLGYKALIHLPDCNPGEGWKVTGGLHVDDVSVMALQALTGQVSGSTDATSGNAYVVNDGESHCGWDKTYVLSEEKWADFNICPPFHCEVKTIIVPKIEGTIYWEADLISLNASASVQQATFTVGGGAGAKLCLKRASLSPPIIVATYSPQIKSGGFVANLLHDLIRIVAVGVESPLATTLGTSVSFTSYLSAALGTTLCPQ